VEAAFRGKRVVDTPLSNCTVCARSFAVKFRYQVREDADGFSYFCSQMCQQKDVAEPSQKASAKAHSDIAPAPAAPSAVHVPRPQSVASASSSKSAGPCACDVCGRSFAFEFPFQVSANDRGTNYFCSMSCRSAAKAGVLGVTRAGARTGQGPRRIAVFNHKGGTGKTTTAVNLAAGLAEAGNRVLLVDADGQGNVGASLGIRGEHTLYHVLVQGISVERAAVPVRDKLDVLTSNELLAAAELHLATRPNRDRIMRERLGERVSGYDVVVIDCAPALSLMNQNALVYADSVLIPVSCDYLSLVGVKQVLRTLKSVREMLKHDVSILGVLPTFYDARANISRDAIAALKDHFGERCLPPIRVSTKLREAPSVKKTIFEHAPDSTAAEDYARVVEHIRRIRGDAGLLDRATTSEVGLRAPSPGHDLRGPTEATHAQQTLPDTMSALAG
jgi:chromosome partitioning protein